jgi:catechol 2,3-dioxygenase-like lactoylglutathione lyase family enzyme
LTRIGSLEERTAQCAIELRVAELARSIAFYVEAGFTLERRTPTFAALRLSDRYLLLSETPGAQAGPTPPNIRITVADIEAALVRTKSLGWPITHPLADKGYGLRDFTVADPDGYELRFATPVEGQDGCSR